MKPRRARAFTLVELLTVIAIVAVLSATLIPTIRNVLNSARKATCVSNLKQIGTAMMAYVSENAGMLPASGSALSDPAPANGNRTGQNWWGELGVLLFQRARSDGTAVPFTEFSNVMYCPTYRTQFEEYEGVQTARSHPGYGMNIRPFAQQGDWTTPNRERYLLEQILFPARTVLVGEAYKSMNFSPAQDGVFSTRPPVLGNNPEVHDGLAHYLFADGHVESLSPEAAAAYIKLRSLN